MVVYHASIDVRCKIASPVLLSHVALSGPKTPTKAGMLFRMSEIPLCGGARLSGPKSRKSFVYVSPFPLGWRRQYLGKAERRRCWEYSGMLTEKRMMPLCYSKRRCAQAP